MRLSKLTLAQVKPTNAEGHLVHAAYSPKETMGALPFIFGHTRRALEACDKFVSFLD